MSVQPRLRCLNGAAISRTATTAGAKRGEVNLGPAGQYARSHNVVHDDAAGAAGGGQGMADQRASVPPLEAREFRGKSTDSCVPNRREGSGSYAGLQDALHIVIAVDDPGAHRKKRNPRPDRRSDWG